MTPPSRQVGRSEAERQGTAERQSTAVRQNTAEPRGIGDQYIVFALQETRFVVPILQVLRITRKLPMTRVPRAPDFLEGVVNDHGQVVPVVDLRRRMALSGAPEDEDAVRLLILELPATAGGVDQVVATMVDAVVGITRIAASEFQPAPAMVAQVNGVYLRGVARVDERLVMLLDLARILTIDEAAEVSRLHEESDAR